MRRLARTESGFLQFVRLLVQGGSTQRLVAFLAPKQPLNDRVGETALTLVQQTLQKGAVLTLAKEGGGRPEDRPVGSPDDLRSGRLWDRHPVPQLHFSSWSFAVLQWAYREPMVGPSRWPTAPAEPALGDRLVAWWLARVLLQGGFDRGYGAIEHEPLARLALAGRLAGPIVDWASWLDAGGVLLLEGLQEGLGRAWAAAEHDKMALVDPELLASWGHAQSRLLVSLQGELGERNRMDLADFLLAAGAVLVPRPEAPPALDPTALLPSRSLRERTNARRASAALCQAIVRLEAELQTARTTRFFEDDYEAAQARLRRWERFGSRRARVFREAAARLSD